MIEETLSNLFWAGVAVFKIAVVIALVVYMAGLFGK